MQAAKLTYKCEYNSSNYADMRYDHGDSGVCRMFTYLRTLFSATIVFLSDADTT